MQSAKLISISDSWLNEMFEVERLILTLSSAVPCQGVANWVCTSRKAFLKNVFKYNNAFCMAFLRENWVSRGEGQSSFNPTVTIQGGIYHFLGALEPAPGTRPAFCLCTIKTQNLTNYPSSDLSRAGRELFTNLGSILHQNNTNVQSFMSLHELARYNVPTDRYKIIIYADKRHAKGHVRDTCQ